MLQIIFKIQTQSLVNCFLVWFRVSFLMQSVPITTKVVSSNPGHGQMYLIQHYVIKFVSDLCQVGGFLWVIRLPPPIKLTAMI
jgi:hypothetical protein